MNHYLSISTRKTMTMGSDEYPLISCLCLTEKRPEFLQRAIHYFLNQTYPNKELVIAYPSHDLLTGQFLRDRNHTGIITLLFENSREISLGKKRNLAIEKSNGKYFCVWDDDDWHHPLRLEQQFDALIKSNAKSCVLSRIILYDDITRKSYLSGKRKAWENTLLCEKAITRLPAFQYADLQQGEDSVFVSALLEHHLTVATDQPELYVYAQHGKNTCSRSHWEKNIIGWGSELSDADSQVIERVTKDNAKYSDAVGLLNDIILRTKA